MSNYSVKEIVSLVRRFGMERDRFVSLLARESGIGRTEFVALDYLEEAGVLTPNQLSERLLLTSGATTALIDRLEAAGMLSRHPHPTDRRSWQLRLTSKTSGAGAKQLAPYLHDLGAAARRLSASERTAIGEFLHEAVAAAVRNSDKRTTGQNKA